MNSKRGLTRARDVDPIAGTEIDLSDGHRITFHEFNPASDKLVVCFAPQAGGMNSSGFGAGVCQKNGWNYVFVGKKRLSNFASLSPERFVETLSPLLPGRDVIAYGTSAGGNAALFFGGLIDARILSASPRDAKNAPGYALPIEKTRAASRNPTIVYDFHQVRDAKLVARWMQLHYPDARRIDVPNSGHQALARLKEAGTLSHLVKSFVNDREIDPESLKFAPGTFQRRFDDAIRGATAGHHAAVMADLERYDDIAADPKLLHIYLDCVFHAGGPEQQKRVQDLLASGHIRPGELGGKASRNLRAILER